MKTTTAATTKPNTYESVTARVIAALERGVIPWQKPWKAGEAAPSNPRSGTKYRGINHFLLSLAAMERGFPSNKWMTYKQAADLGGQVRKGAKAESVIFWKQFSVEDKVSGDQKFIPLLKTYSVFNVAEIDGLPEALVTETPDGVEHSPIEAAEKIVAEMPNAPAIKHNKGDRACYSPSKDIVTMPHLSQFTAPEAYYCTLFHELGHSTGHLSRLSRDGITKAGNSFGSSPYAKEELIAEMTAAFLCAEIGIDAPVIENTSAYIKNWLGVLKSDSKAVVLAAAAAQKAADYALGRTFEEQAS